MFMAEHAGRQLLGQALASRQPRGWSCWPAPATSIVFAAETHFVPVVW